MLGILSDSTLPLPILLDAIAHSETGHLSPAEAAVAKSRKGARGKYQFLEKNLHDMGFGMPRNIPLSDVLDPTKARQLAGQYVTGYTANKNFTTPLQQLVAYNAGPDFAEEWIARGENIDELPLETQQYITNAAEYLTKNQQPITEEPQMANITIDTPFGPMLFDAGQAAVLADMQKQGDPRDPVLNSRAYRALMENITDGIMKRQMAGMPSNAPAPVAPAPVLAEPPEGVQYDVGGGASSQTPALYQPGTVPTGMGSIAAGGAPAGQPTRTRIDITQANGFSRNPPPTLNRRDQSALSMQPPRGIGLNEYLIRMGAAGLEGSAKGGLEGLGAIGRTYGELKDLERAGMAAYQKAMTSGKKRPTGNPVSPYNAVVLDTLNDIIPALDGDTSWFSAEAGLPGAIFRQFPGSRATDFAAKLDTLKANIGFDRLQKMRDESPTGGALGQVSEMELRQLNAALGSLEQNQSPQQLQENLKRIRDHYIRAVSALEAEYAAAGIDISSKIQPMAASGGQMTGMGVGQSMTIGGQTVTRIK